MNAVPLTDPSGTIRAWACGVCWNVNLGYSHAWAYGPEDVEEMRRRAERCCTCFDCGAPRPPPANSCLYCEPCRAKHDTMFEALLNARKDPTTTMECVACHGTGRCSSCEDECGRCDGSGTLAAPFPNDPV